METVGKYIIHESYGKQLRETIHITFFQSQQIPQNLQIPEYEINHLKIPGSNAKNVPYEPHTENLCQELLIDKTL